MAACRLKARLRITSYKKFQGNFVYHKWQVYEGSCFVFFVLFLFACQFFYSNPCLVVYAWRKSISYTWRRVQCEHDPPYLPVWISMILGTKHGQQQAEEQHHQTQTNHNYNWKWKSKVVKHNLDSRICDSTHANVKEPPYSSRNEVSLLHCFHREPKHI